MNDRRIDVLGAALVGVGSRSRSRRCFRDLLRMETMVHRRTGCSFAAGYLEAAGCVEDADGYYAGHDEGMP